jgi:hypothetical protein
MAKKRSKNILENKVLLLIIVGIILLVLLLVFFLKPLEEDSEIVESLTACDTLDLKIQEISANYNTLKLIRGVGEGNLAKVQVLINEDFEYIAAIDLKESETKQIILDINEGDQVKIIPILNDGIICSISDSVIA